MPLQQADPRMKMRKMFLALAGLFMATAAFAQADPEAPAQAPVAPPPAEPENVLNLDLSTGGRVVIHLRPDKAPSHVERIKTLARQGFYDGLLFHRLIVGFMAQPAAPQGTLGKAECGDRVVREVVLPVVGVS